MKFIDFKVGITKDIYVENTSYYEELFAVVPQFRKEPGLSKIKDKEPISYLLERKCIENIKYDVLDFEKNYLSDIRGKVCEFIIEWGVSAPKFYFI